MFTRPRYLILLSIAAALLAVPGCRTAHLPDTPAPASQSNDLHQRHVAQFALSRSELTLAQSGKSFMVIDLSNKRLELRLGGAVVWNADMHLPPADSVKVTAFVKRFRGDRGCLIRELNESYLYAARDQVPESVLAIISEATNFKPGLMQRRVPQRFSLRWDGDAVIDIQTELDSAQTFNLRNELHDLQGTLSRPFGSATLSVSISPEAAITLYRVAHPGLPTLIHTGH